jgi:hypothetical protein
LENIMSTQDDLTAISNDLSTLSTAVQTAVTDLSSTAPSPADNVLAAVVSAINTAGLVEVFTADALSAALTAANYTVTAPAPELPESATEDATDTSTEA